ncbi:L-lysine 6-monooxygenase [Streptomyces agglomeratus]|uniref:L-lysine N6-monooxygenase MbtG n=1 Tax=Streptomyces agglomeratus TaxID=285458 RepID=A0A1E5P4V6_9ACTN|nr:SidA/IucD/PvdA family monooxygenase [Streptomyces agglomeratus]OEJ24565.1 L-lysine 6-monooxygenase [Streptomyces agglomeratus]OEJ41482.1 L-lysine 6-monooxygenase [Streptomyces agglomeratus]OEJ44138.1 L-lysine 6-monooxygenase [Streptomyces agglomeratus]OEJ53973.1 L-lysine 6-monooxygenase [Streptomyces agglomeratus]
MPENVVYDVVGVGFGPANLSLAVALTEHADDLTSLFLDRAPSMSWHGGMLLPGAKMQVAFLKDLATFRNPVSRFSFVAYLHDTGRLAQFVNNRDFFTTRRDFHAYLDWAEAGLADQVRRGVTVTGIEPTGNGDSMRVLMEGANGTDSTEARNVVISTGLVPKMPPGIAEDQYVWHSSRFLDNYRAVRGPLRRVGVAGAGQSAAELVRYLYDHLPDAEIFAFVPSYGYSVADSTPFANRVFDPQGMDDFYSAPAQTKSAIWQYHKNTNYSVVDDGVIRDLYQRAYDEETSGRDRLHFHTMARVESAKRMADDTRVTVYSMLSDSSYELDLDVLICATGYDPMDPAKLLGGMDGCLARDEEGRYRVRRDHRLVTASESACGVYLQGGTEHTHGLSASLLSNIAIRSGEIADSVAAAKRARR